MNPCPECGGTGFVYVAREGREYAQPCQCRRAAQGGVDPAEHCRIPPRYEHCTFDNFEPRTGSLLDAVSKARRYCEGYPYLGPAEEGLGLLFNGDSGVGKTHLAVAILKLLVEKKGVRGQFWDFHALIREIKNSYNPETLTTELQVLEPVVETDLLLLDDLGAWKMTDWMNDTLFYILNSRYMAKRSTIITTNYQDADREAVLAADPLRRREFLVERVGQRVRSRLQEMCLVIHIKAGDYRQVQQESNTEVVFGQKPAPRTGT